MFCSTVQVQGVKLPFLGVGIAQALPVPPSTSTHPNTGAPIFTLCISHNAWGPQRLEFWQAGAFCSQTLVYGLTCNCVIGSLILCHLHPPMVWVNPVYSCPIPVCKAGKWAAARLWMSNHISCTAEGKLGENGHSLLGQGQGILQAPWRVTAVFFYYSWASLVQQRKWYLCGSWGNSYNKKTENSKAQRQATFSPRLKLQRLQYLRWFCWHWSWTHLLLRPVSGSFISHSKKIKPPRPTPSFFGPMLVQQPICLFELLWANGPASVISLYWFWSGWWHRG